MFSIQEIPFGPITEYRLYADSGEYVSVLPGFGAALNQVVLRKQDKLHELLDGCDSYDQLMSEGKTKFKGTKLFPFPNRIADGRYEFENNTYQFPINFPNEQNAIHGILMETVFTETARDVSTLKASLTIQYTTSGTEAGYPFKIEIKVSYTLDEAGFTCETSVQNKSAVTIPVGDGWHPYFKTGSLMDDCLLTLPVEKSYEVDSRMIPTGKTKEEVVFTTPKKIGLYRFDTGYKLAKSVTKRAFTIVEDPANQLKMKVWQEAGEGLYNYVQIYIPPDRKSIAIEPMTCLANAFNNKEGLLILSPGESRNFSFGLMLE